MKRLFYLTLIITGSLFVFTNCNKDDDNDGPPMGVFELNVTDESGSGTDGVLVYLYDGDSGEPTGASYTTAEGGMLSLEVEVGNYFVKLYKQGFESIPMQGGSPTPFDVSDGETTTLSYTMKTSSVVDGGWISGTASIGDSGLGGVMVVANLADKSYSGLSNSDGIYYIFNVPAGTYSIKGYKSGYNSSVISTVVVADEEVTGQDITMTDDATASLTGSVSFLSSGGEDADIPKGSVDVTLIDPISGEPVPGLSVITDNGNYSIEGIPNGDYIARATYANDTYVVDPDWLFKFGEPSVKVADNNITITLNGVVKDRLDFSVTGAVTLTSPKNLFPKAVPDEINKIDLTFTWRPYSSTTDYAFELIDANGTTIWGGISGTPGTLVKEIIINPKNDGTSYIYPSDGSAPALTVGETYRWVIYASKNDTNAPEGWKLISMSEDQMGLFKIVE